MKITITGQKTVDVAFLKVSAGVRYWEDATVNGEEDTYGNLIPCRNGDYWEPLIEIETGKVLNWTPGTIADIHYKVCDDGKYELKAIDGSVIHYHEGYVPAIMSPGGNGYGDYIIMNIDENGMIAGWKPVVFWA